MEVIESRKQKTALKEIDDFLKVENEQVFILQGTSQSGKTHLIPFIEKLHRTFIVEPKTICS